MNPTLVAFDFLREGKITLKNLIIVGSGPAGYTAAIYAARANLEPVLVTSAVEAGGELMKTTEVENFPGFPDGVMGPELMTKLQEQAEKFGTELIYDDATKLELDGDVKRVTLGSGDVLEARTVIISTGSKYRELGLPNERHLSGHGLSWCATCDGFFFRDKSIAVIGGGDSAMEEATFLTRFASKVTVIHRRDQLRASQIMQKRAFDNPKIEFIWNSEVAGYIGDDQISGLRLRNTVDGSESEVDFDGVFVAIGNYPRVELVRDQVNLTPKGTIAVDGRSSRTNLPGVFAAGDVIDDTYRQAISAAGSGCVAALDAEHYLADIASPATA